MNRRKAKKLQKKFNYGCLNARQSCVYCINWGIGCANGHPDVYPNDRSDYYYFCKGKMDAYKCLAKRLKIEGFSLSGWSFFESPARNFYIFYNKKKHKDITVLYDSEKSEYQIASTDMFWKYSNKYNVYVHSFIREALNAPWQHWNFVFDVSHKTNKKTRKRTIEKLRHRIMQQIL